MTVPKGDINFADGTPRLVLSVERDDEQGFNVLKVNGPQTQIIVGAHTSPGTTADDN